MLILRLDEYCFLKTSIKAENRLFCEVFAENWRQKKICSVLLCVSGH